MRGSTGKGGVWAGRREGGASHEEKGGARMHEQPRTKGSQIELTREGDNEVPGKREVFDKSTAPRKIADYLEGVPGRSKLGNQTNKHLKGSP